MSKPRALGSLEGQDDGGMWIIEVGDRRYLLNDTARAIWELCDGLTTPNEMVDAVALLTGISEEVARDDVVSTVEELANLGLVVDGPDQAGD